MPLEIFFKRYSFVKVSVLILSGFGVQTLESELRKHHPKLIVIYINKTENLHLSTGRITDLCDQSRIWQLVNSSFIPEFCKELVSTETYDLSGKVANLFELVKHKAVMRLIYTFWEISKEDDIDRYLFLSRTDFEEESKILNADKCNADMFLFEEEYLKFEEGKVSTIFNGDEDFDFEGIVPIAFNEKISELLEMIADKNTHLINIYGPIPSLEIISREIAFTLKRGGEKHM